LPYVVGKGIIRIEMKNMELQYLEVYGINAHIGFTEE
jgi:hypothetical protein